MMVVFLTSLADGQDTRRISARTSRKNCVVLVQSPGTFVRPAGLRRTFVPASGSAPVISLCSSFMDTRAALKLSWQGYQDPRRISARTSRKNCVVLVQSPGTFVRPAGLRRTFVPASDKD